ncbi:MAG: right-handed parallel beta-helix repeat-containing protein [Pseudomonadales bacterium]|nr:right-handed parallel beta-helix repeat-containing protein [Pseudomonadales bacterium]
MKLDKNKFVIGRAASILAPAALAMVVTGCGGGGSSSGGGAPAQDPVGYQYPQDMPADVAQKEIACGGEGAIELDANNLTDSAKIAFLDAQDGDVIVFPEGTFKLQDTLTLDGELSGNRVADVTICGQGMDKTILDFSDSAGDDGLFITNIDDVEIYGLAVTEAANNAIKLQHANGVRIHYTATVWQGEPDKGNGAYGLYPVESSNVLVENSYVRGSADAGIYVGQSDSIVVRNNIAEYNVAGIEIENSTNADMYNNIARYNTGGLLVFDLPIGNDKYGSGVRVFGNEVYENNTKNFANSSSNPGGVHIVPPGTGVIVLSTDDVEIFDNTVEKHDTLAVAVTSFLLADENVFGGDYDSVIADGWLPLVRNIHVHDNTISETGAAPNGALIQDMITLFTLTPGLEWPALIYDGAGEQLANTGALAGIGIGAYEAGDKVCFQNNSGATIGYPYDPATAATMEGPTLSPAVGTDFLDCSQEPLPAATLTFKGEMFGCVVDDTTSEHCEVAPL